MRFCRAGFTPPNLAPQFIGGLFNPDFILLRRIYIGVDLCIDTDYPPVYLKSDVARPGYLPSVALGEGGAPADSQKSTTLSPLTLLSYRSDLPALD
jgi:hypothetical protein